MARILDLTTESGIFAARLFAEAGHDVVRVLPQGGAPQSGFDLFMNAGKRGVAIDLETPAGRSLLARLAGSSDLILAVEPGILSREELRAAAPDAALVMLTDDEPELLAAAGCGLMSLTGHPGQAPKVPGAHVLFAATGLYVSVAARTALLTRGATGKGEMVTVSIRQCLESLMEQAMIDWTFAGKPTERRGGRGAITAVSGALRCADGWWMLSLLHSGEGWTRMMNWMRDAELAADPELADEANRHKKPDYILDRIEAWSMTMTRARLVAEAQEHHIPASPVCTPFDLVADEQLADRGFLVAVDLPDRRRIAFPKGAIATIFGTDIGFMRPARPEELVP